MSSLYTLMIVRKASLVLALGFICTQALAQDIPGFGGYPACAGDNCVATGFASCGLSVPCACSGVSMLKSVAYCIGEHCSMSDATKSYGVALSWCREYDTKLHISRPEWMDEVRAGEGSGQGGGSNGGGGGSSTSNSTPPQGNGSGGHSNNNGSAGNSSASGGGGLSTGAIIGIAIAAVGSIATLLGVWYARKTYKQGRGRNAEQETGYHHRVGDRPMEYSRQSYGEYMQGPFR